MSRLSWDDLWIQTAQLVGRRSSCERDQVGAVVVTAENRIVDTGYNGPPAGWGAIHSDGCTVWCPRAREADLHPEDALLHPDYEDCVSLHAEANALMFSDRRDREGGTIYVSSGICYGCAKLVANSGLAQAVWVSSRRPGGDAHRDPFRSHRFLEECGLVVTCYTVARLPG